MTAANADVLLSDWTDEDHSYYLGHMPISIGSDVMTWSQHRGTRQRWSRNHCVPTTTTNVLKHRTAWISTSTLVQPPEGSAFSYNTAGEFIEELGDDMNTDPWSGTNYEDYYAEIVDPANAADSWSSCTSPTTTTHSRGWRDRRSTAVSVPGPVQLLQRQRHGRRLPQNLPQRRAHDHLHAGMGLGRHQDHDRARSGHRRRLLPGRVHGRSWQVEERLVEVNGDRRMQCFLYEDGDDYTDGRRYLDGYISIIPNPSTVGVNTTTACGSSHPSTICSVIRSVRSSKRLSTGRSGTTCRIMTFDHWPCLRRQASIWSSNLIGSTSMPTATVSNDCSIACDLCWGNLGELWAADSGQLKVMQRAADAGDWGLSNAYDLRAGRCNGCGCRQRRNATYFITRQLLLLAQAGTNGQPQSFDAPDDPGPPGRNRLMMNCATGALIIWNAEARSLWSLAHVAGQNGMVATQQLIPDMERSTDVEIDDLGRLLAARDGKVAAYKRADQGMWTPDESHRFNGLALGGAAKRFTMLRSSAIPGVTSIPSELDNQPDIPQSRVTRTKSWTATRTSISTATWMSPICWPCSPVGVSEGGLGDIDNDGKIDVADLLELIEAWGACDW